jgi:hypothetical protein
LPSKVMTVEQPPVGSEQYYCVACDRPATRWVRDLLIIFPPEPQGHVSYQGATDFRAFCDLHARPVRVYNEQGQRDGYWEFQFNHELEEPDEETNNPPQ